MRSKKRANKVLQASRTVRESEPRRIELPALVQQSWVGEDGTINVITDLEMSDAASMAETRNMGRSVHIRTVFNIKAGDLPTGFRLWIFKSRL